MSDLRIGADGRLERATIGDGDIYAGKCDADGWAYLNFSSSGTDSVSPGGTAGDLQWAGTSGFSATPMVGRNLATSVESSGDSLVTTYSTIGHHTAAADSPATIGLGPGLAAQQVACVDIVVSITAVVSGTFRTGRHSIRARIARGSGPASVVTGGTDSAPDVDSALSSVTVTVDVDSNAPALAISGLSSSAVTFGWESRVQYQAVEV